jgi:hypothetical protein
MEDAVEPVEIEICFPYSKRTWDLAFRCFWNYYSAIGCYRQWRTSCLDFRDAMIRTPDNLSKALAFEGYDSLIPALLIFLT